MQEVDLVPRKYIDTLCLHCEKPWGIVDRQTVRNEIYTKVKFDGGVYSMSAWVPNHMIESLHNVI